VTVLLLASLAVIVRLTEAPAGGVAVLPETVNLVVSPTVTLAVLVPPAAVQVCQSAVTK
jgi:hypothetical protein